MRYVGGARYFAVVARGFSMMFAILCGLGGLVWAFALVVVLVNSSGDRGFGGGAR